MDNAEGTVLSYADQYTFSINLNQGVFEVQCDSQVLSTGRVFYSCCHGCRKVYIVSEGLICSNVVPMGCYTV